MHHKILELIDIYASYYKKPVLNGVSIDVNEGEIVGIIGPNGAGKSTCLKVIFGILKPTSGKIIYKNEDITNKEIRYRCNNGMAYFIQGGSVFTNLTVMENLQISANDKRVATPRVEKIFNIFPEIEKYKYIRAGFLSGGEKHMLALSMMLVREPKLLLLDEPSAGLAPLLVKRIGEIIKRIKDEMKITILLVEQNILQAMSIVDKVYLLKLGQVIAYDKPENIMKEKKLHDAFFK